MADKEEKKGFSIKKLKVDKEMANDGVWIDYNTVFRVKVAKIGCRKYKSFLAEAQKPHTRQITRGTMDQDLMEQITRKALAHAILIDWEGLLGEDGELLPYTEDNAYEVLTECEDFCDEIIALAKDQDNFRKDEVDAAVKN
jgi:hypothetical protein